MAIGSTKITWVDIGHHYVALSRRQFELHKVSPIDYEPPVLEVECEQK